ncbi:MAG: hypothetical protein L7S63_04730 [Flavobacteriales bacterium]|nr:hypothetical protein [Flavobacteriales bacterium]
MNQMRPFLLVFLGAFAASMSALGQSEETVWFDGASRSFFSRDALGESDAPDTTSARNLSEGYNLLDLNVHIAPAENLEVFAQLRVRNSFGGFFGAGTSVDVRQLRASGVIKNKVRFGVGDLYLKQSRFTLFNPDEDLSQGEGEAFRAYRDILRYENFYEGNRWRLQGLQADFSLQFDRTIRTLEFDGFITRPRGSESLTNTLFIPDMLFGGGGVAAQLNQKTRAEINWVNLFEVPASGTTYLSLRNPVLRGSVSRQGEVGDWKVDRTVQGGYSQRHWLYSQLNEAGKDSLGYTTEGVFFEWKDAWMRSDSSFQFHVGLRHVDPGFRSGGAQTRRLDLGGNVPLAVYPNYTDAVLSRPMAMFDLLASDGLYNQMLSGTLMDFNPAFSNVQPYGDATPNRQGLFFGAQGQSGDATFEYGLDGGVYREVIGQGIPDLRNFAQWALRLTWNADRALSWNKAASLSVAYDAEQTTRSGEEVAAVDLNRSLLHAFANVEVAERLFVQASIKQLDAQGREFLTERTDLGEIRTFNQVDYDLTDHILSAGMWYAFSDAVYANVQYSGWGASFAQPGAPDFNYRRLMFVFSVRV